MKKMRKNKDLYFYKGKFYTDLGLKRVLAKEGELTFSRGTFYLYESVFECYYRFDYLRDLLHDYKLITDDEYKHFRKWLNKKIENKEISVLRDYTFYHCDANYNAGGDWNYALEALRNYGTSEGEQIKTDEEIIEDYCQVLTDEQFKTFCKLPEARQSTIASKWAIKEYHEKQRKDAVPY